MVHLEPTWHDAQGFLDTVRRQKDLDTDPNRFRVLVKEYNLEPSIGKYCTSYHVKAEDYGAARTDGALFLMLEAQGLGCMHPNDPNFYFEVFASERSKPTEASSELRTIGDSFVKSFRFE